MHALVLHSVGDLRYEEVPQPSPAWGEVKVRIAFCGVCGSDIPRVFVKGTYRFPTIPGHEFAGVVEELGEGVTRFQVGDPVAVFPLLWCGRCAACEQGKYVMCHDYDYLGSRSDGGFAEYVIAPERNLLKVPPGVSLEEASMTEPAAVALHAVRCGGGTGIGESVAIFGAGPIGVMAAQWVRTLGTSQVILFDIIPEKLALAHDLGFEHVFDSRMEDPLSVLNHLTGNRGVDLAIEAAGCPPTTLQALAAAARGGRVVLLGNPSGDVTLPMELISQVMRREVRICGTWNSEYSHTGNRNDWSEVLEALASHRIHLSKLVTHRIALNAGAGAFSMMRDRTEFFSKVLITPDQTN